MLPPQPAAERAESFVDSRNVWSGRLTYEGSVDETEAKVGFEPGTESTHLLVEDGSVGPTTMKAKDAREECI